MPKNRKTIDQLRLSGATRRNPGRYANRADTPQFNGRLGEPPSRLNIAERSAWREIAAMAPEGVLWKSDRLLVELASKLMVKIRKNGIGGDKGATAGEVGLLMKCLGSMGLSPADRSKVDLGAKTGESENVFAELADEHQAVN